MTMELDKIMPVILAGGKSSRMGGNKAFAAIGGKPLLTIVIEKLRSWFNAPPLLVTNTPGSYAHLGLPMTGDIFPDAGPLGGIHAALSRSDKRCIFVVGCDMPFLQRGLIRYMAKVMDTDIHDLAAPCDDGGHPEPLHAIYSANCLLAVEDCLKRGEKKVAAFFPQVRALYLEQREIEPFSPDGLAFMNVNTPQDLLLARSIWEKCQ